MSSRKIIRLIAVREKLGDVEVTGFKYVDDETGEQVECPQDQSDVILDPNVKHGPQSR